MKSFLHQLAFSTQQKKGAIVLIALLILYRGIQWGIHTPSKSRPIHTLDIPSFASAPPTKLIPIGINSSDTLALQGIPGIGPVLSRRIIRFRKMKRGFSSLEDLKEVYGLSLNTYTQILPYLYLDSIPGSLAKQATRRISFRPYIKKKAQIIPLDINQATAQEFEKLPGIGPVLSKRIVRYRQAKGAFDHPNDLQKVYKLPDSTFQNIFPYLFVSTQVKPFGNPNLNKDSAKLTFHTLKENQAIPSTLTPSSPLNVNTADTSLLKQLPGIGTVLSKRIVSYRKIIGFYSKVEYLEKVYGITPETMETLRPFLYVDSTNWGKKEDLNMIPEWKLKKYPFWLESELTAFLLWRNKIRRVDSWEEVKASNVLKEHTLKQMKIYFDL